MARNDEMRTRTWTHVVDLWTHVVDLDLDFDPDLDLGVDFEYDYVDFANGATLRFQTAEVGRRKPARLIGRSSETEFIATSISIVFGSKPVHR